MRRAVPEAAAGNQCRWPCIVHRISKISIEQSDIEVLSTAHSFSVALVTCRAYLCASYTDALLSRPCATKGVCHRRAPFDTQHHYPMADHLGPKHSSRYQCDMHIIVTTTSLPNPSWSWSRDRRPRCHITRHRHSPRPPPLEVHLEVGVGVTSRCRGSRRPRHDAATALPPPRLEVELEVWTEGLGDGAGQVPDVRPVHGPAKQHEPAIG